MAEEIEANQLDYWSALTEYRNRDLKTARDKLYALNRRGLRGEARLSFWKEILFDWCFHNNGDNSALVEAALDVDFAKLRGDIDIPRLAKKAAEDAGFLIRSHNNQWVDAGLWEETNIPGIQINIANTSPNIHQQGLHLIHAGIGSGKSSNLMIPQAAKHQKGSRALIIVPNTDRAIEIANILGNGWEHYHVFGNDQDDKRRAFRESERLVVCAASLRLANFNEHDSWPTVYLDEVTEVFNYASSYLNKKQAWWKDSLAQLPQFVARANQFFAYTADAPTSYTRAILQEIGREYGKAMFYYRTSESYGQYQTYEIAKSDEDLVWEVARRINSGQSAWGFVDFAGEKLRGFAQEIQALCPGKSIEWWDSSKIQDGTNPMSQAFRDLGLAGYVKEKRRRRELDAIIFSPVAKSQHSYLVNNADSDLIFDFSFSLISTTFICSPWEADQALGRARQTKRRIIRIHPDKWGTHSITENAGKKRKEELQAVDLTNATAEERLWHFTVERYLQFEAANKASPEWLFRQIVREKGALCFDLSIEVPPDDLDNYLKIAERLKKIFASKQRRIHTNQTRKISLLNRGYRRKDSGWGSVQRENIDWKELEDAVSVDSYGAEQIYTILLMDESDRERVDREIEETYYSTTFHILEIIFFELFDAIQLQKLTNFFQWFETGDEEAFFILEEKAQKALDQAIANDWEYVKRTLDPPTYSCGSLTGLLRVIGNLVGLDFVLKVNREERTKWNRALFDQYRQEHPYVWVTNEADGMEYQTPWGKTKQAQKYAFIESKLREKLTKRGFTPTYEESRMLDTLSDVVRVTKKPLVSRSVVNVYRHFSLRYSESSLEQNPVSNALQKIHYKTA